MAIKAFFFDIGGVVVSADLERYLERAARMLKADPDDVQRETSHHVRGLERGELTSLQFWELVGTALEQKSLGKQAPRKKQYRLWRKVMLDSLEVNLPLLRVVQSLGRRGYILGALSNTIFDHAEILEANGIYAPFTPTILSCQVGSRKPEPAIYRMAARAAGVAPQECLLVDDSELNLPMARECGFSTFHFKNAADFLSYLHKRRFLSRHDLNPPLATPRVVVDLSSGPPPETQSEGDEPDEDQVEADLDGHKNSEEPPLPGPPSDVSQDPWLAGEEQFPWKQSLQEQLKFCLHYAVLAPSYANNQPWRYLVEGSQVQLSVDTQDTLRELDPEGRQQVIACGASFRLLEVATHFFGFETEVEKPEGQAHWLARLVARQAADIARQQRLPHDQVRNFRVIPYLRPDFRAYMPPPEEASLEKLADFSDKVLIGEQDVKALQADLLARNAQRWSDPDLRFLLMSILKRSHTWDGGTLGLGSLTCKIYKLILPHTGALGSYLDARALKRTPGFALLTSEGDERDDWFEAGRRLADFMIAARLEGLSCSPIWWVPENPELRQSLSPEQPLQVLMRLGRHFNTRPEPRKPLLEILAAEQTAAKTDPAKV